MGKMKVSVFVFVFVMKVTIFVSLATESRCMQLIGFNLLTKSVWFIKVVILELIYSKTVSSDFEIGFILFSMYPTYDYD